MSSVLTFSLATYNLSFDTSVLRTFLPFERQRETTVVIPKSSHSDLLENIITIRKKNGKKNKGKTNTKKKN